MLQSITAVAAEWYGSCLSCQKSGSDFSRLESIQPLESNTWSNNLDDMGRSAYHIAYLAHAEG